MDIAFSCRLQCNPDISKIRKFFEETDTLMIAAGRAGIAFFETTKDRECYNTAMIHSCDIYQLKVNTTVSDIWKRGGVVRILSSINLINFIKNKGVNDDLLIEIDKDATALRLAVINGSNTIRDTVITLTIPDMADEYPVITNANVVIKVSEFKKLCSDMAKAGNEIKIESQANAIRMTAGTHKVHYGSWCNTDPFETSTVKPDAFNKATKINIGNTKNSLAGIYIQPGMPLLLRTKLGLVDFGIFARRYILDV